MYETYPKGSRTPNQNVTNPQEIGKDRYVPKMAGGKDGKPGEPSGKTSYPPNGRKNGMSTDKHHTNVRGPWAKGGGNKQVSFAAPKSRTKFGTEKSCGKDEFVPKTKSTYGVGGV